MGLHSGVGLVGECEFGCMLGGGGCAFFFIDFEAHHHLIYNGVGVMEAKSVDRSAGFSELKVSFSEFVLEIIPSFVCWSSVFPRTDVVFENSLFVEDNKGEVYCLTSG